MKEPTTFSLTCDKTLEDFESALRDLANGGPIFMAQVRPRLSENGFSWVGSISDCVNAMASVAVKWDSRPLPVDFLVLRDEADNELYLSKNPKFSLGKRVDASTNAAPVSRERYPLVRVGVIRRVVDWIRGLLSLRRCIKQKHWDRYVAQLKANPSWTVCFVFNDGRESFTASSFVNGDPDAVMIQHGGVQDLVERSTVASMSLVKKAPQENLTVGRSGTARVTFWKFKFEGSGFGYLEDSKAGEQFYFTTSGILDDQLKQSLVAGKYGQIVQYAVVKPGEGTRYAVAQITRMIRDYAVVDPLYQDGHRAMISGNLVQAEKSLSLVVERPESESRLSAIKDLAEVYNRQGDPRRAYALIEKWRDHFDAGEEQTSFEMMEVLYLERMGDGASLKTAVDKIGKLLAGHDFAENRRRHFEAKRVKLLDRIKADGTGENQCETRVKEQDEQIAALVRDSGLSAEVLNRLTAAGCGSELVERLRRFVSALSWTEQVGIMSTLKDDISEADISSEIIDALIDAIDRRLTDHAEAESSLAVLNRCGDGLLQLEDSLVKVKLALYLPDPSAVPLRDLCVTMASESGGQTVTPCTIEKLSSAQGKFPLELVYCPSATERETGVCEAEVSVIYNKDVVKDFASKISVGGSLKERCNFRIGSSTAAFEPIDNPYEKCCYHIAEGDLFVGREQLLGKIAGVLEHESGGQSYVLYGQDRCGKTSIRRNLQGLLEAKLGSRLLYTETSGHGWTSRMLSTDPVEYMTYDLKISAIHRLKEIGVWSETHQAEFNEIPASYHSKKLEYLGECLHTADIVWIVVIDEFTDLYDLLQSTGKDQATLAKLLDLLYVLKGLLESRKPTFNLFLIGRDSMPRFKKDYWNAFAVSKPIRVERLKEDDTKQLLQRPLAASVKFEVSALDRYYYYVGGYPFYAMMFCKRVVEYINEHRRSVIYEDDIDKVAESFCRGDAKLPPEEFNPFVALYTPPEEIDDDVLMEVYYEVARKSNDLEGCPKDSFAARPEYLNTFKELESRGVFHEYENGTVRLHLGLLGKYLQENPKLECDDFKSAWAG